MGNHDKTNNPKETILRFGLLIDKIIEGNQVRLEVKSQNNGIPDAEVILIVEAWLEKMKDNFKQPIKDGMGLFSKDDDNK